MEKIEYREANVNDAEEIVSFYNRVGGETTEIIRRLIEWCKGNGITTRIQLDTRCDNELAVSLYKKFGFEIEGCLKNTTLLNGTYYDLYVMGLMIH